MESDVPWPAPLLPDPEKGMVNTYINNSGLKSQIKVYMWQSWEYDASIYFKCIIVHHSAISLNFH